MKKLFAIVALFSLSFMATQSFAQNAFQKGAVVGNAGLILESGFTPIVIGAEYGVSDDIGIAPRLWFNTGTGGGTALQVLGNYHFARIFNVNGDKLDPYAGLGLEKVFVTGSNITAQLQLGSRYFVNDKVGPYAQINIGLAQYRGSAFELGVAYKFGQ